MSAELPIAPLVLKWAKTAGRSDLPWQKTNDPYKIWLSEIMLQQTRAVTVIPHFEKFVRRFPSISELASADSRYVLHQWSGLGYYARALNLHQTAKIIVRQFAGSFPDQLTALCSLPGIGKSTAGAIMAAAFGKRGVILDGNVKRVLCRYHRIAGIPSTAAVNRQFWQLAETQTPLRQPGAYNQALMDLGATVCTPTRPDCELCPLNATCPTAKEGDWHNFPARKKPRKLPQRTTCMLIIRKSQHQVLLVQRPPVGIWRSLWCFPEISHRDQLSQTLGELGIQPTASPLEIAAVKHVFTHFRLTIRPLLIRSTAGLNRIADDRQLLWYNLNSPPELGLPAPISRLLKNLPKQ